MACPTPHDTHDSPSSLQPKPYRPSQVRAANRHAPPAASATTSSVRLSKVREAVSPPSCVAIHTTKTADSTPAPPTNQAKGGKGPQRSAPFPPVVDIPASH